MARIRTIKPEFWSDEKLAPLDSHTRLVFLGLISHADDAGRLVDSVRQLDGLIFPFTDDTCSDALEILARLSRVSRYTSASGQKLIQIVGWEKHQRVDNPSKYTLPPPPPEVVSASRDTESSRDPREDVARSSRSDLRPTTYDHGPTTVERSAAHARLSVERLYGYNGTEGTDPLLVKAFADTDARDRCLDIAWERMQAEGREYQGRFFRRILDTVMAEQAQTTNGKSGTIHDPIFDGID